MTNKKTKAAGKTRGNKTGKALEVLYVPNAPSIKRSAPVPISGQVSNALALLRTPQPSDEYTQRYLESMRGKWECNLVMHLLDRCFQYPLPNIQFTGVNEYLRQRFNQAIPVTGGLGMGAYDHPHGVSMVSAKTLGSVLNGPFINNSTMSGRYNVFNGSLRDDIVLTIAANSTSKYVFVLDPYCEDQPVKVFGTASGGVPGVTFGKVLEWTADPYAYCGAYQSTDPPVAPEDGVSVISSASSAARPALTSSQVKKYNANTTLGSSWSACRISDDSLVFPGGFKVMLEAVTQTAYTATAFRVRGMNNTIHNLEGLFTTYNEATADYSDFGIQEPFKQTKSVHCVYSGQMWGYAVQTALLPVNVGFDYPAVMARAMLNNFPIIEILVTNSGPAASSVALNTTVYGWAGVAPLSITQAGACSLETVPCVLPAWFGLGQCLGGVDYGNTVDMLTSSLSRGEFSPVVSRTLPLLGQPQVRSEVAKNITSVQQGGNRNLWQRLKSALSGVNWGKVARYGTEAVKLGVDVLNARRGNVAPLARDVPLLLGDVETVD